jgi:hypothetical protein
MRRFRSRKRRSFYPSCAIRGVTRTAIASISAACVRMFPPAIKLYYAPERMKTHRRALPRSSIFWADQYGYNGVSENYENIENADLITAIEKRKGLPIVLAILTLEAGRAQGWNVEGINFPGHFLVRMEEGGGANHLRPFSRLSSFAGSRFAGAVKENRRAFGGAFGKNVRARRKPRSFAAAAKQYQAAPRSRPRITKAHWRRSRICGCSPRRTQG